MPGRPSNLISTNLPRPWSPQESSPSGKIPTVEPGIFLICVFIGTYTLPSQQVYSCSLLVSLWYTVHNVTASRDESLREWAMLLSEMYIAWC